MGDLPASLAAARQRALNGGQRPRPRPLPRTPQQPYRSAFWDAPETNLPYRAPEQALADRNTLPYLRQETLPQRQVRNDMAQLADRSAAGGSTGYAERNQVREFGNSLMEATGAPSWARGIEDIQYGQPGKAIPEFLNGALATSSLATLPYGAGASAPIRGFQRPLMRNVTPGTADMFVPGGDGWLGRQAEVSARSRDVAETADNLGSIQMPELEVPQSPYDDWLAARRAVMPEMIETQRAMDAANGGKDSVEGLISLGTHPQLSYDLPYAIGEDLGPYAVGGRLENHPVLGTPDIAADPMTFPRRPGFGPRPQLPLRQGPNEDRYLFGRPPIRQSMVGGSNDLAEAAGMRPQQAPDGGASGAGNVGAIRDFTGSQTDRSAYGFSGPSDTAYVVSIEPETNGAFSVRLAEAGASTGQSGQRSPADARAIYRRTLEAIHDDARRRGRTSYTWRGDTPQQQRVYEAAFNRIEPPAGYVRERRGNAFVWRRAPDAPNASNAPPRTTEALDAGRIQLSDLQHQDPLTATFPWEQRYTPTEDMVRDALTRGATRGPASDREVASWRAREHAERIATLMREGWDDPITLRNVEGRLAVDDGYHRLAAARLRGDTSIQARPRTPPRPRPPRRQQ